MEPSDTLLSTPCPNLPTPGDIGLRPVEPRKQHLTASLSGPVSCDVQSVVRETLVLYLAVVLPLRTPTSSVAKRILDFSFGLSYSLDAVGSVADRVFVVLPSWRLFLTQVFDSLLIEGDTVNWRFLCSRIMF